jgi:putative membrane protein
MKKFQVFLFAAVTSLMMFSCGNNDEADNTTENKDPGNTDSVGTGATNNNNMDNVDATFLTDAAYGGMKEVEAGNVAKKKGKSQDVKNLANMMVTDHTAMNEKVKALAAKKNVQLPDSLRTEDMDMIRNNKKTGAEFDKEYANMMVQDHEDTIRKFENAANNAKDPEIKALANEALPKLRHHLEMSKQTKEKVKG